MARTPADTGLSPEAQDFSWTVNAFVRDTAGVTDAIVVSADGLPIAASDTRGRAEADRLSAIVSGLSSLAGAVSQTEALGPLNKVIMDLADGYLLVMAIGHGALLGVLSTKGSDLGTIAFEMTVFANRAGARLTPPLIHELRNSRPL
jgi:predicted regulator of Ras-like GTPase activity (Roadblock/LC7/MglB family)